MPLNFFISGGCRSGKSAYAQALAERFLKHGHGLFIATAYAGDEEMRRRVAAHQASRGPCWRVHEPAPGYARNLPALLPDIAAGADVVLLDCLGLWVSAYMEEADPACNPQDFITTCALLLDVLDKLPCAAITVSVEVGLGLVPESAASRTFRDCAGLANQMAAAKAANALFMVSGFPLLLKGRMPA